MQVLATKRQDISRTGPWTTLTVNRLAHEHEAEVLAFLDERPVHTFGMVGFIYLEGVWVDPQERGNGIGSRCMSQLGRSLLMRSSSVCLLVNEKSESARAFYKSAGYKFIGYYDSIFLKQQTH